MVLGLAAQSTLGNLIAGVSITLYRPFRLGDMLQVTAPTGTDVGVVELISLGYTTLRAADGHLIVLPNSIAASQVTINLNTSYAPGTIVILITLARSADWEAARLLALDVAKESAGGARVAGCYLTKVDTGTVSLELRVAGSDVAGREALRSTLLSALVKRFETTRTGTVGEVMPAFS